MIPARFLPAGLAVLVGATLLAAADEKRPQRPGREANRPDVSRILERFDKNEDGFLDRSESPGPIRPRFDRLDRDGDGKLSREELQTVAQERGNPRRSRAQGPPDRLFRLLDADRDGRLSKEELQNAVQLLEKFDRDEDGLIAPDELRRPGGRGRRPGRRGGRPGEINTPPARGERHKDQLQLGDRAPDFTLPQAAGGPDITLSDFRGKKPVVLAFASCT